MSTSARNRASAPTSSIQAGPQRARGRPLKRSRPPDASRSCSLVNTPAPVKRRKLQRAGSALQDNVFAIKDIIDEKSVRDKLFFRIDWEDNPVTGETYEPTWVSCFRMSSLASARYPLSPPPMDTMLTSLPTGTCRTRKQGRY